MKVVLVLCGMVSFTVIANLLLKTGAIAGTPGQGIGHLVNWRVLLGFVSFGVAACFYTALMQWVPLNVATSFAAAQFVAVIVAARFFLSEPIDWMQWAGIALIALGISLVGWSQR